MITTLRHLDYPRCNTNNPWHSIATHFQDGTGSVSVILHIWKVANTLFMNESNQLPLSFTKKECHCIGYGEQWPAHSSITVHRRLNIAYTPWTVISRMGHSVWFYNCYFCRQPILCWWMAATNKHLGYPRCKANASWDSMEARLLNGAVIVSFPLLPSTAAIMLVMDSSDHITIELQNI
jgi:hypothetical protein